MITKHRQKVCHFDSVLGPVESRHVSSLYRAGHTVIIVLLDAGVW
jgi:hypothetical protein